MKMHLFKKVVSIFLVISLLQISALRLKGSEKNPKDDLKKTDSIENDRTAPNAVEEPGKVSKKKMKRWILPAVIGAVVLGSVITYYFLKKHEKDKEEEERNKFHVFVRDVENSSISINSQLTFKTQAGETITGVSGKGFDFKPDSIITDISVANQGDYFPGYVVFKDESGNILGWKDKNGMKNLISLSGYKKMYVELIRNGGFDIIRYGKCLGDYYGNLVIRYDKKIINLGVVDKEIEVTDQHINIINDFIAKFNAAGKEVVSLNYIGKVSQNLEDGITFYLWSAWSAVAIISKPDNYKIRYSSFCVHPLHEFKIIYMMGFIAATCLSFSSSFGDWPYSTDNDLTEEGKRAIHLQYSLPLGFSISDKIIPTGEFSSKTIHNVNEKTLKNISGPDTVIQYFPQFGFRKK